MLCSDVGNLKWCFDVLFLFMNGNKVAFDSTKSKVSLFGGRSLVLGEDSADEELYIYGNRSCFNGFGSGNIDSTHSLVVAIDLVLSLPFRLMCRLLSFEYLAKAFAAVSCV